MIPFPDKKYEIIYADPPWPYNESGSKAKVKDRHYSMMQLDEICALPVNDIQAETCILFLWVTAPRLPMAFQVMEAWGFQYHSLGFDWMKVSKSGKPMWGPGYYTRQNNEFCLIGVPKDKKRRVKPLVHDVLAPVVEQRREHSRKPDSVRENIVRICGDRPRIELFARQRADGWDAWGNEVPADENQSCRINAEEVERMAELKPCPFCGGKAGFRYLKHASYIYCSGCHVLVGVSFCPSESQDEEKFVTEAWNRRGVTPDE